MNLIALINFFKNKLNRYFNKSNLINDFNINYKFNKFINKRKSGIIIINFNFKNQNL